jgi:urate oxidase
MATLSANRYGKDLVRVVRVTRNGPVHDIKDVAVRVLLEGSKLETSYYNGDNSWVVPTDTIKNTVYVLAKKHPFTDIEVFGITIARHFLNEYAHYSKAEVTISERPWNRMVIEGKPHDHSFLPGSGEERTAVVRLARESMDAPQVTSGMRNLLVMKTTGSEFVGFPKDKYTTLKEATHPIFKTTVTVEWDYVCQRKPVDYTAVYNRAKEIILHVFATTYSKAVQQTVWEMGRQIIAKNDDVKNVHFTLPNQHNWLFDLKPFGLENNNEIFVPQADPQGYIQGTVSRDNGPKKAAL